MRDVNVHQRSWLRHSARDSPEGRALQSFCATHGLLEIVGKPTRGAHLLDVCLTDLDGRASAKVVAGISDHDAVTVKLRLSMPRNDEVRRVVHEYRRANWSGLKAYFSDVEWFRALPSSDPEKATAVMPSIILDGVRRFIPCRQIVECKGQHPWFNDHCRRLVAERDAAFGGPSFDCRRDACSKGILEAYDAHIGRVRSSVQRLKLSSRAWWKLANSL